MRARGLFGIVLVGALAGCAGVLGFDAFLPGTEPDAGGAGELPEARWHVSPKGDDANDGSRERPVRSLRQAVRLAEAAAASGAFTVLDGGTDLRIALCAGDYEEAPLTITGPIEIRGDYDCTSWLRAPLDEDGRGATRPSSSKVSLVTPEALTPAFVSTADRAGSPLLEGVSILATRVGSIVSTRGTTRLHDVTVMALADPQPVRGATVGIAVDGDGVTIEHSTVQMRRLGQEDAPQAIAAIGVTDSTVTVRRNVIDIGEILGGTIGLSVTRSTVLAEENTVTTGNFVAADEQGASAYGIAADASKLTSIRNAIEFQTFGRVHGGVVRVVGLATVHNSGAAAPCTSDGDIIVAPSVPDVSLEPATVEFLGVFDAGSLVRLTNASIIVDAKGYALEPGTSSAIYFVEPTKALIAHNSIFLSSLGTTTDGGVRPLRGVFTASDRNGSGSSALEFQSNLTITDDPRALLLRTSCSEPGVAGAFHNRFAGFTNGTSGCANGGIDTVPWPGVDASDNVALACDGGCDGVYRRGPGEAERGLELEPGAACPLDLNVPFSEAVSADATGAPRKKDGTTAGAFERTCP